MSDLEVALYSGTGLAALTALTILAYKHPKAYERIAASILIALLIGMVVAVARDFGMYAGVDAIDSLLSREKRLTTYDLVSAKTWIGTKEFFIWAALCAYLIFLAELPKLLAHDEPKKE